METESKAADWHTMNSHFPCSAMLDAGWNSTKHHCLRGEVYHYEALFSTGCYLNTQLKTNVYF